MIQSDRRRITRLWLIGCAFTLACCLACGGLLNTLSALVPGGSSIAWSHLLVAAAVWLGLSAIAWPMTALWVKWSREAATRFPGYGEPDSTHTCGYCGYDLAGLPTTTTCPECGSILKRGDNPC